MSITKKSCGFCAALLFSMHVSGSPGDSLRKRSCACEVNQLMAEREFMEIQKKAPVVFYKKIKVSKRTDFFFTKAKVKKASRKKHKSDPVSRCWK